MAAASARAAVAIGDSITDGRGTGTNTNNRWTDIVSARMQAKPTTADVSMLNQGIGATNLVGNSGTAAQARFNRDVLGQSRVHYAAHPTAISTLTRLSPTAETRQNCRQHSHSGRKQMGCTRALRAIKKWETRLSSICSRSSSLPHFFCLFSERKNQDL